MAVELIQADYRNPQHGADLLTVLRHYATDVMGGGDDLSDDVQRNLLAALAKQSGAFSVLAYVDGKPAGLANCFEGFSTFACMPLINIHDFAVMSEFRGMQLSQQLLQEVEQIARNKGCCKVTLEVLEGNTVAQNAYLKYGFEGYDLPGGQGQALFWQKKLG
ncbi:GNAT family N-acetyltransferase [Neiella marina]|uniref:GNAT family N-acetyltransferase n=1 Tax=Neiella holothuriorum TaxID=2870530 RepID=A0ABS7EC86_9GAMM|nr:GNAT family N-acetyltransferase [Neiella holothuriorum]MBW8189461.1 GNAT family N-acetyltransferase [Neiella holothuriorum]